MGVRGLTRYIAQYAEQYLVPYELHDCSLVIDGDCLACNLYKDYSGSYSAFGGDYDDFYRGVIHFFEILIACNIQPYVLMDGGYEKRKLRQVSQRMRGKIAVIKRINPCDSSPIFPRWLKEVFIDAVKACDIPIMRCIFEADQELATLSRKLNCPVLSYDSDFYIYNVLYIPLVTLTLKIHTKIIKGNDVMIQEGRKLRHTEVRHLQKRVNHNKILNNIKIENSSNQCNTNNNNTTSNNCKRVSYKFLDCCIYRVEHFVKLSQEKLPLFSALLGNDYISRSSFINVTIHSISRRARSSKNNSQHRRIKNIINWFKHETAETALAKILERLSIRKKAQLMEAISAYSTEVCHSFNYFASTSKNELQDMSHLKQYNVDIFEDVIEDEDEETEIDETEVLEHMVSSNSDIHSSDNDVIDLDEKIHHSVENNDLNDLNNDVDNARIEYDEENIDKNNLLKTFPQWFLDKLYSANLPRFFVDLVFLRKYINDPQIEHYPYNDCNEVALPILKYTFTLLSNAMFPKDKNELEADNTDGNGKNSFIYLTRQALVTNVHYKEYEVEELPKLSFDPYKPDALLLNEFFERNLPKLSTAQLFNAIGDLPTDLRLYFLSIVYWLQKSQHCNLIHLHALIICLVVLRTVDSKIPAERNMRIFKKRFIKIIERERQIRDQQQKIDGCKRQIRKDLLELSVSERMAHVTKSDCLLVQDNLLKYFYMPDIFKKKYDTYSTITLHAFAEFQAITYHIHSLNVLLDFVYPAPRFNQLYCGVFLYNLYELLKSRPDPFYYVENFLLQDSQMMFDFYKYLWHWSYSFVPHWKILQNTNKCISIGKSRNARKKAKKRLQIQQMSNNIDNYVNRNDDNSNVDNDNDNDGYNSEVDDYFYDINNKFCTFLKISK